MSLNKYYCSAVIYPSLIAILLTSAFSVIDNHDYQSEWLTPNSVIFISILTVILYSLLICGLALTIFLNRYEKIGGNPLLKTLSWFLLPGGCISIALLNDISHRLKYEMEFDTSFIYVLLLNVPFILGIIRSYLKFTRTDSAELN
jgi:hypothetical protein